MEDLCKGGNDFVGEEAIANLKIISLNFSITVACLSFLGVEGPGISVSGGRSEEDGGGDGDSEWDISSPF